MTKLEEVFTGLWEKEAAKIPPKIQQTMAEKKIEKPAKKVVTK